MDIGTPPTYLLGIELYLEYLEKTEPERLAEGINILGNAIIDPTAEIAGQCIIGPNVSIGAQCVIGTGVMIQNSAILPGTKIEAHSYIKNSIIGW